MSIPSLEDLRAFIVRAHRNGYATGGAESGDDPDAGKILRYEDGAFRYLDRYYGSRSFVGLETVFYDDVPVWGMHYHGSPTNEAVDHDPVYVVLRSALAAVSDESPFRGPRTFDRDGYRYQTEFEGTIRRFSGTETIESGEEVVYRGRYSGCVID